ncbi:MAG TPA: pyruvate dehydrogenase (acetyl-transferring) E1 component subunit alpha [Bacteroidota bacterium]|nr:pyruvate dehydrogenase (acetyl-transferring) E1 component subunit alpha [Bacteroidota bacterium]
MKSTAVASPTQNHSKLLGLSRETLLSWYDDMLLVRRFEEKCAQLYGMGRIMGFCHLYIGQEAVSTGAIKGALNPDDYVITAYRDHGQAISKGVDPKAILAELLGKYTGTTKGKGGSMHIFDSSTNFMGGHAIVGGHIPLASGIAFAIKYRKEKKVCLCFMGDGATNIGSFHEGLNLAGLWKLPVIFIIENNKYGMGTAVNRASAVEDLHKKAIAYNIKSEVVDGMDVLEVYAKVKAAADRARETYEPTLLEIETYRFRGHSMSDPVHGVYRSKDEVERVKKSDPILLFGETLKEEDVVKDDYFEEAEKRIKKIVEECVEFTENSPDPPLEELWKDVYYDGKGE